MSGQRVLLIAGDRFVRHALEEIIGLVVFPHMVQAEMPVLLLLAAAFRRAMRRGVLALRPFTHGHIFLHARLLLLRGGLDADLVEVFRFEGHG